MANRQDFNALRRQYEGRPEIVERLNMLERQERELRTAEGEHKERLQQLMKRTADELEALIKG